MTALLQAEGLALPGRLRPTGLTMRAGEFVCLIGPNGSGKTSLLHAIAGIGRPEGNTVVDGQELGTVPRVRRRRLLSFLPATRDVKWPLAARDLIALGGAGREEIEAAAATLDIGEFLDRRVDRLSTGERSRVLIARALAPSSKLLLLDEPTANLDPLWQIRVMDLLKERIAASGTAALVAIHDLDAAARHAGRLIVMQDGAIAADGAPEDVLSGPVISRIFGIERVDGSWRPA